MLPGGWGILESMGRTLTQSNLGGPPPIGTRSAYWRGRRGRPRPVRSRSSRQASITGIIVLMCASIMTFASFVSAMVVRRGLNNDWGHIGLPHILWWNTGALILSSIAIDTGRRLLRKGNRAAIQLVLVGRRGAGDVVSCRPGDGLDQLAASRLLYQGSSEQRVLLRVDLGARGARGRRVGRGDVRGISRAAV